MTVSCPSYVPDAHALDWARAVSAESSPHRFQMMRESVSGPSFPADTASGRKRKWLQLGY
jgi:hypothetical protein